MTTDELARLEQAATPAPWSWRPTGVWRTVGYADAPFWQEARLGGGNGGQARVFMADSVQRCDAEFIIAARNALPGLLTRLAAAERLAALWSGHEFDQYVRGIGYCCPVCAFEEMQHTPDCELAAALSEWRALAREGGHD